ncbi:MAG: hypothetical protein ACRDJ5_07405 [Actinomycetota bacterium]
MLNGYIRRALPHGGSLPLELWYRRHRALVVLVWLHGLGVAIYGALQGYPPAHVALEAGAIIVFAALASSCRSPVTPRMRTFCTAMVAMGLLTSSALLIHLSGGLIEMHFHFFVVIGLLTLYQDWGPFLIALGYVVVHHGVMGALAPMAVFNHPSATDHPWRWAALHGVFVLAASTTHVVAWRASEATRAHAHEATQRLELARLKQRQALEINDTVVQGLTVAKYAAEVGDDMTAAQAVERTLDEARSLIGRLLGPDDGAGVLEAGDLVRLEPAKVTAERE